MICDCDDDGFGLENENENENETESESGKKSGIERLTSTSNGTAKPMK